MRIERIVLGTSNPAKVDEWTKLLQEEIPGLEVKAAVKLPEPNETGETFEENAVLKAIHYAKLTGDFALADDGGFEIDAFDGAPGVKSKRILPGEREATDKEQIEYVINKMEGMPQEKRGTRFTTAVAVSAPDGKIIYEDRESLEGYVPEKAGKKLIKGYSYRSLLYLPELGKTYAELNEEEHNEHSHKRKIVKRLAKFLRNTTA